MIKLKEITDMEKNPIILYYSFFVKIAVIVLIFSHTKFDFLFRDYFCDFSFISRPFWISPRQSIVVPVAPPFDEYAHKVKIKRE